MYNLEVTQEQAHIIQNALDLYSRVLIGQFEEIGNVIKWETTGWKDLDGNDVTSENLHKFIDTIRLLKELYMGISSNGSHGIHSPNVSDKARKAWDIQKVIRHKVAWDSVGKDPQKEQRTSSMFGVSFDEPYKSSLEENFKLPIITKKLENE